MNEEKKDIFLRCSSKGNRDISASGSGANNNIQQTQINNPERNDSTKSNDGNLNENKKKKVK